VKSEWRVLSSQTIGVEFASKIIRVGTGSRRKRIKLQVRGHSIFLTRNRAKSFSSFGIQQEQNDSAPFQDHTTVVLPAQYSYTISHPTTPFLHYLPL
jgi:hypothetical protein